MMFGASEILQKLRRLRDDAVAIQGHFASLSEFIELYENAKKSNPTNPTGSMLSTLTQMVETALTTAVKDFNIAFGLNVSTTTHDGMIVDGEHATWELHGEEWQLVWEDTNLLERYSEVCERICPGINMRCAWKRLDNEIHDEDGFSTGRLVEVPDSFIETDSMEEGEGQGFDREHPEYDTLFDEVRGFCFQVGTNFINVKCQERPGEITLFDEKHLRVWFRTWNYYTLEDKTEYDPIARAVEVVGGKLVPHDFF